MNTPAWKAFLICLAMSGLFVGLMKFNPPGIFWPGIETPKAQCEAFNGSRLRSLPAVSPAIYDDAKINRLIREPQNTLSNLPYAAVGLAVLMAARRTLTRAWAVGCVFLGIGSGLYHASLLPEWRLIDILGVYVALFGLFAIGLASVFQSQPQPGKELRASALVWIAAFWTGIHRNDVRIWGLKLFDSTYVVVIGVACSSLLVLGAFVRTQEKRRYFQALAILAIASPLAFLGGWGDRFGGFLANPDALIQGHSVWHVLGAFSLLAAYEIFASTGYDESIFKRIESGNVAGQATVPKPLPQGP